MQNLGPTSNSFISQRLRLHYLDWGNADAPPLLLLHGGRDHARSWDWVAAQLKDDWHVIAPDWRGHGDSAWAPDGDYRPLSYVYDLAQLIHQLKLAPVTIVAHSRRAQDFGQRLRDWIEAKRKAAARQPRRYATLDDALARMREENGFLSEEQARHLTIHGVNRNEDGSWSWKFDNYLNLPWVSDIDPDESAQLWSRITCPTLLMYGEKSWASNPAVDGRLAHFTKRISPTRGSSPSRMPATGSTTTNMIGSWRS